MAETKVSVKVSPLPLSKLTAESASSPSSFGGTSAVPCAGMAANSYDRLRNSGGTAARRAVVERAEAYIRAHFDGPVPISRLCHVTGVSERGLRNAFYGVHGMGPKRWMLTERLMHTQVALRASQSATTVTAVATDFGFYQLGRFAAIYKKTFGEAPSETLHAAGFVRGRSTHNPKKEHSDAIWL